MSMYDDLVGISRALNSLKALNSLIEARRRAGYERHEQLLQWVVLGRFYFDSCGNIWKFAKENVPAEKFPDLPMVLSIKGFNEYIKMVSQTEERISFTSSLGSDIPPAHLRCPECGEPWAVSNCHDTIVSHETRMVPMADFACRPFSDIKARWAKTTHAIWRLHPKRSVRNDLYIDLTPVESVRGSEITWATNEGGWIEPSEDYIIQPGDEALVDIWTFRHVKCHKDHLARAERRYFEGIFSEAGFKDVLFLEIPAQYEPGDRKAPWFEVLADGILFTIGWRHRVINIITFDRRINFTKLFPREDVTKDVGLIHAWGKDACIAYLRIVRDAIIKK